MVYRIFTLYRANACQLPSWDHLCSLTETERLALIEEVVHCHIPPTLPHDWSASQNERACFARVTGRIQPTTSLRDAVIPYDAQPPHCLQVYRRHFLDIPVAERSACYPVLCEIIEAYCQVHCRHQAKHLFSIR